jgi:hypothetical protein
MATFKKKQLDEMVGGDVFSGGNDRNVTNDSEIETGPVQKPFDDKSDYEKGVSTTSDRVFGRYRQNIPWFAVYSFGGTRAAGVGNVSENETTIVNKKTVEEKIEDLVKKSKSSDVLDKDSNPTVGKLIDSIKDSELTEKQIEELEKIINLNKNKTNKPKNL